MVQWRNESQLLNAIIRVLYPHCVLHRVNVGRMRTPDGRWFSTGVPVGYPDLSGYRRSDGRAVYIECKVNNSLSSQGLRNADASPVSATRPKTL